jgi:hypothetical protein
VQVFPPRVPQSPNDGPITILVFIVRTVRFVWGVRRDARLLYSMARVRRQWVDRPQEDQLANTGSGPLPLRMYDNVPCNLFTSISRYYMWPPSEPNTDGTNRTCFGGCLLDVVQAHLLLQQPVVVDIAKIITDAVLVNLCLFMPRMTLCRR